MNFSTQSEKIIADSRLIAIELRSDHLSSFHFLIATLKSHNLPQKIFIEKGFKFETLSSLLNKRKKKKLEKYFLTKELETSLTNAKYYSQTYFDNEIMPEHILLSMIADKKSFAGIYLNENGLDYSTFKNVCKQHRPMKSKTILEFLGKNKSVLSFRIIKLVNFTIK